MMLVRERHGLFTNDPLAGLVGRADQQVSHDQHTERTHGPSRKGSVARACLHSDGKSAASRSPSKQMLSELAKTLSKKRSGRPLIQPSIRHRLLVNGEAESRWRISALQGEYPDLLGLGVVDARQHPSRLARADRQELRCRPVSRGGPLAKAEIRIEESDEDCFRRSRDRSDEVIRDG